jgi:hypothetical protein
MRLPVKAPGMSPKVALLVLPPAFVPPLLLLLVTAAAAALPQSRFSARDPVT